MKTFSRRPLFAFALGAALTAAVMLGHAAHATGGTINACFKPSNGTLYLLGADSGRTACQPGDIPISWNTAGVNGQDGTSVTSRQLAPHEDPACPAGGSKFTSASGVTYACNGADGQDGDDFSGTFTSPNGQFSLSVDDTGARLVSPAYGSVQITSSGVVVQAAGGLSLESGGALDAKSGTGMTIDAGSALHAKSAAGMTIDAGGALNAKSAAGMTLEAGNALNAKSGTGMTLDAGNTLTARSATGLSLETAGTLRAEAATAIDLLGLRIFMNSASGCKPAARLGDAVAVDTTTGVGLITQGFPSVCIGS